MDTSTYESNHRPKSLIYQNKQEVPEYTADRRTAWIIGPTYTTEGGGEPATKGQILNNTNYPQQAVLIRSSADIETWLLNKDASNNYIAATSYDINPLAYTAALALIAGGNKPFYVIAAFDEASLTETNYTLSGAIKILSHSDKCMFLSGLTYESASITVLNTATQLVSDAANQRWRRLYTATKDNPTSKGDTATASEIVTAVAAASTALNSDRVINVWTSGAKIATIGADGTISYSSLDNRAIAAAIAVYRSSLAPQQGISRKNLPWINSCSDMYSKFTNDELNTAAVGGTFIITQDDADDKVYIRHQLTTDMEQGIMYFEDSVGINIDSISYGIKDIVNQYIGVRNNTNDTLIEIRNRVSDYLSSLTNTGVSPDARKIGPQIVGIVEGSLVVALDKNIADRVNISVDVIIPLPINQIIVHLNTFVTYNS